MDSLPTAAKTGRILETKKNASSFRQRIHIWGKAKRGKCSVTETKPRSSILTERNKHTLSQPKSGWRTPPAPAGRNTANQGPYVAYV